MREQEIIARYFAGVAKAAEDVLLGVGDDAAVLAAPPGKLLISTDTLNAGVHFLPEDSPYTLARKAAAVSLSDIAAMGGRALWLTVALTAPKETAGAWFELFAQGLARSSAEYDYRLVGGDLTCGAHLSITTTAVGVCTTPATRHTADAGEVLWVSGALGGAAFALAARRGELPRQTVSAHAMHSLHDPTPRLQVAASLAGKVSAMMDVSDGLLSSARTLAEQSGVALHLNAAAVPMHPDLRQLTQAMRQRYAFTGGDDYELLFTAPADAPIPPQVAGVKLTPIGKVTHGSGVTVQAADGSALTFDKDGYSHDFG